MITKKDIQITGIHPFYNGLEKKNGSIKEYVLSHIDIEFLLFKTIRCEMTNYNLKFDDLDYVTNSLVEYINSKL